MKHVVEYKLHADQIPYFISDGGYFHNNGKLIGVTKDDVNCHVPPSTELVTFDTVEDFISHIKTLPLIEVSGVALTDEEKATLALSWWTAHV